MNKIGKYTIDGEIGKGGMGVVYRGVDPYIGRTVAIKTIRLDISVQGGSKDEALKRFIREAQAAGNLSHPNIVTIYDVGEDEGMIYIAMAYIDGQSLETLLLQNKRFSLDEIIHLFSQIGSALDYAHQKGIVHRDVKPANILVDQNNQVTIVDFGIARTARSTMTQAGIFLGTPRYMSPEQISGKQVDNRSDIFSLGAILYELLTQRNPFEGESITTVIYKIMNAELPPISDFNKQLPEELDGVVRKALAKDAEDRYRSCQELCNDLKKVAAAKGKPDTVKESTEVFAETELIGGPDGGFSASPGKKTKSLFILLAVIIGLLGLAVGVIKFVGRRSGLSASPGGTAAGSSVSQPATDAEAGKIPELMPENKTNTPATKTVTQTPTDKAFVSGQAQTAKTAETQTQTKQTAAGPELAASDKTRNKKGFAEQVFFNRTVMVHIPQGNFTCGSPPGEGNPDEYPAHQVFVGDFWLGKYEVTFEQYDFFCRETGRSLPTDEGWGRGDRPVINVSWDEAQAYCQWLGKKSGRNFRLPSEAEWEKAARERFPWGSSPPTADKVNMRGTRDGFPFTAPVGKFPLGESHYGIMDLAGNVWEWISDWYDEHYYQISAERDPLGPTSGVNRVVRGGSWKNGPELIRSANRSSERPDRRLNVIGFRVAMDNR